MRPQVRRQTGFSIVELMVGLVLGLLLLAAALKLYLDSSRSLRMNIAQAQIQDSARFAGHFLGRLLRQAGYMAQHDADRAELFPPAAPALAGQENATASPLKSGSDRAVVRYQGNADGSQVNCAGLAVPAGSIEVLSIYLDSSGRLICEDAALPGDGTARVLLDQVDDLQMLYGLDTTPADGVDGVTRYTSADNVADFDSVRTVRLALRITSPDSVPDLDRLFNFTVSLRNRS